MDKNIKTNNHKTFATISLVLGFIGLIIILLYIYFLIFSCDLNILDKSTRYNIETANDIIIIIINNILSAIISIIGLSLGYISVIKINIKEYFNIEKEQKKRKNNITILGVSGISFNILNFILIANIYFHFFLY